MGRMDCASFDNFDHCEWCGDVRNEEDVGKQKGEEKENSRKCRDERRQLLPA